MAALSATEGSVAAAAAGVAAVKMEEEDPYRSHRLGEAEKQTEWRHGVPPSYDAVNELFEQTRTQAWPKGSLEQVVQDLVKSWEMELSHKTRIQDFKTIHLEKFRISVNGGPWYSAEETLKVGSYNALLGDLDSYKASKETFESSHDIFRKVFPKGFAWEVLEVYSGPPAVSFKYRHWGIMEGPYEEHNCTGEVIESFGIAIAKVDENLRIMDLEVFYDRTQFLGQLTKGPKSMEHKEGQPGTVDCPFMKGTT